MNDSAEGSGKDLEEGTPEGPEEDSREDSKENCEENNLSKCSKSLVNLNGNLKKNHEKISSEKTTAASSSSSSSPSTTSIVSETAKQEDSSGDSTESSTEQNKKLLSSKIGGSFFQLIPGSEADISGAKYSCILQSTAAATILTDEQPSCSNAGKIQEEGNFLFMYRGSEADLNEKVIRHSGGSDGSEENVLCSAAKLFTPDICDDTVKKYNIYSNPICEGACGSSCSLKSNKVGKEIAAKCSEQCCSLFTSSSKHCVKDVGIGDSNVAVCSICTETNSDESLAIVEDTLLQEIEDCLQKYFEASSSEEENFATRLSQLVCTNQAEISQEEAKEECSLEDGEESKDSFEHFDICIDSDSYEEESEENVQEQLKVCLKKGCTNLSCKCKDKKKVFFLCDNDDYQKLLKEEGEGDEDEDFCGDGDSSKNKSP